MGLASVVMGAVVVATVALVEPMLASGAPLSSRALGLGVVVLSGMLVYAAATVATGVLSVTQLRRFLVRRR